MNNKQLVCDKLLEALNASGRNDAEYNHIVGLKYIERKGCCNMLGQPLPDGEYIRVQWSNNPERDDGYYDINVNGDNAFGVLIDVVQYLNKKF